MIVSNFCSCRNGQQASAESNPSKETLVETTLTPNTANAPCQEPALVPVLTLYI